MDTHHIILCSHYLCIPTQKNSSSSKNKKGTGLPPGPGGILGAAEGLSYLALLAGLAVLVAQVANYGYIPNAVPMDGGMCS